MTASMDRDAKSKRWYCEQNAAYNNYFYYCRIVSIISIVGSTISVSIV